MAQLDGIFFCKRTIYILPLKFTLLIKTPFDFRKHNTWLVLYFMAGGGIEDKKNRKKNKKVVPFIEEDHGVPQGSMCWALSQCTRKKQHTTETAMLMSSSTGENVFPRL